MSPNIKFCSLCSNLLGDAPGEKCSVCLDGYRPLTGGGCEKCPINYLTCQEGSSSCNFPEYTNLDENCAFNTNPIIEDSYFGTEKTFFTSLFEVGGSSNQTGIINCGQYSVIGPANFGQQIQRTLVRLPPHIQLTLNFNIFIFDQLAR